MGNILSTGGTLDIYVSTAVPGAKSRIANINPKAIKALQNTFKLKIEGINLQWRLIEVVSDPQRRGSASKQESELSELAKEIKKKCEVRIFVKLFVRLKTFLLIITISKL
ncbi:MAG: hypothetical protein LBQ23_03030 [Puniceicoccales bacterium]|jgi:hypothetical protein|nr:hypothetical protein [Puniceicoccales bacterium]